MVNAEPWLEYLPEPRRGRLIDYEVVPSMSAMGVQAVRLEPSVAVFVPGETRRPRPGTTRKFSFLGQEAYWVRKGSTSSITRQAYWF